MKKLLTLSVGILGLLLLTGNGQAALQTIGTANYMGIDYNLIYMDDGPFGPITWLDYSKSGDNNWQNQVDWASGLSFAEADIQLEPAYTSTIDWTKGWRLPEVDESKANLSGYFGYEGPDETGYHNYRYGYNMVNSEMGHLFYEALGNLGYLATDGSYPQEGYGLHKTGDFEQLHADYYWSGTESSIYQEELVWYFRFDWGSQSWGPKHNDVDRPKVLAVRPGDVSAVPIPGTVLLLASGLAGLGLVGKKTRQRRR